MVVGDDGGGGEAEDGGETEAEFDEGGETAAEEDEAEA